MNRQMEMLQDLVCGHTEKEAMRDNDPMKLTRLTDADDIGSYLKTFERLMKGYEVDKARWAFKLVPSTNRLSATSLGHTQAMPL